MKYLKLFENHKYYDYVSDLIITDDYENLQSLIDEYGIEHDYYGETILETAIKKHSKLKMFKFLIVKNGADLSDKGYFEGNTPLLEYCSRYDPDFSNYIDVLRLMIDNGADMLYENNNGDSFFDLIHKSYKRAVIYLFKEYYSEIYNEYLKRKVKK